MILFPLIYQKMYLTIALLNSSEKYNFFFFNIKESLDPF